MQLAESAHQQSNRFEDFQYAQEHWLERDANIARLRVGVTSIVRGRGNKPHIPLAKSFLALYQGTTSVVP
jgi:hypothetical protein